MTLSELIEILAEENQHKVVRHGFRHPHSYRGIYAELAFEPAHDIDVAAMLKSARDAVGHSYLGYKGGSFKMDRFTEVHLATYGETGEELGPTLLKYMLADTVEPIQADPPRGLRPELTITGHTVALSPSTHHWPTRADGSVPQDGDIYVFQNGTWVAEPLGMTLYQAGTVVLSTRKQADAT